MSRFQAFFLSINCLCYFCLAGNFAMMPPAIQRMFGSKNGALIYGLIYSAFGTAAIVTMFISKVWRGETLFQRIFENKKNDSLSPTDV